MGAPKRYSASAARGGEIILRTRLERGVFIAGLAGSIVIAAALMIVAAV